MNKKNSRFEDLSFSVNKGPSGLLERTLLLSYSTTKHDTMGASSSKSAPAVADNISQLIGMFSFLVICSLGMGFMAFALCERVWSGIIFPSGSKNND